MTAIAGGLYLVDSVCYLEQAARTFKQMALEVCSQSIAYHIAAKVVNNARQLVDLCRGKELSLVDKEPVNEPAILAVELECKFV